MGERLYFVINAVVLNYIVLFMKALRMCDTGMIGRYFRTQRTGKVNHCKNIIQKILLPLCFTIH